VATTRQCKYKYVRKACQCCTGRSSCYANCCSACEWQTFIADSPASPLPLSKFMGAILFCLVQAFCKSSAFIFKCSTRAAKGVSTECVSGNLNTWAPFYLCRCGRLPFAGGSSPIRRHLLPATSTSASS